MKASEVFLNMSLKYSFQFKLSTLLVELMLLPKAHFKLWIPFKFLDSYELEQDYQITFNFIQYISIF